jgi:hypothetical protein
MRWCMYQELEFGSPWWIRREIRALMNRGHVFGWWLLVSTVVMGARRRRRGCRRWRTQLIMLLLHLLGAGISVPTLWNFFYAHLETRLRSPSSRWIFFFLPTSSIITIVRCCFAISRVWGREWGLRIFLRILFGLFCFSEWVFCVVEWVLVSISRQDCLLLLLRLWDSCRHIFFGVRSS